MPYKLFYRSGEEIRKGDRILYSGLAGEVELVAVNSDDPEASWYVQEYGGGVMILEATTFGRVFVKAGRLADDEDLEFALRAVEEA
jgi:hypothetical protein